MEQLRRELRNTVIGAFILDLIKEEYKKSLVNIPITEINYNERVIKKEGVQEMARYFYGMILTLKHYEKGND